MYEERFSKQVCACVDYVYNALHYKQGHRLQKCVLLCPCNHEVGLLCRKVRGRGSVYTRKSDSLGANYRLNESSSTSKQREIDSQSMTVLATGFYKLLNSLMTGITQYSLLS